MSTSKEAIQLINELKQFNKKTLDYFKNCINNLDEVGLDYHVISVFGSQSSGKSTLLNALFNTTFDTMNAQVKRQQTTKGIWLSHSKDISTTSELINGRDNNNFFVLDIEGSDGAERGEDQDFERKATLFAISVSEILIVNMWEQQVGLYQGNNMGLLKTVFEVNLSLFHNQKESHKVLLLFVIRDHSGVTPLSSLQESLIIELEKMWVELSKPKGTENLSLYDFFDLKFTGLSHKLFQPEKFHQDIKELGNLLVDDTHKSYYFKSDYHHNLPLDGWTMYAESCWSQIEENKDLDLPTQQILVARFKTEEIANTAYTHFIEEFDQIILDDYNGISLSKRLGHLKDTCLEEYDSSGSRYSKSIYLEKQNELVSKLESKFNGILVLFLNILSNTLISEFKNYINDETDKIPFDEKLKTARKNALDEYDNQTSCFVTMKLVSSLEKNALEFNDGLDKIMSELKIQKSAAITARSKKILEVKLKDQIIHLLSHPSLDLWNLVMETFEITFSGTITKYQSLSDEHIYDFHLGYSQKENDEIYQKIRINAWEVLDNIIHDYLNDNNITLILRNYFENKFHYDQYDSPMLWKNEEEIDKAFKLSREQTLKILDVLSIASTTDGVEIIPDVFTMDSYEEYSKNDHFDHDHKFSHILNNLQKEKIIQNLKRQTDLTVIEAKRSVIKTTAYIPFYIYAIIVILGWNEFMIIIRNPLLVTLLMITLAGFYFVNKLNLWSPLIALANSAVCETQQLAKNKLKNVLFDEHEKKQTEAKGQL